MKCAAITCCNNTANKPYIYFFRFPYEKSLATEWARKAGREDLITRTPSSLCKFSLCEEHFEEKLIIRGTKHRIMLRFGAQPSIFKNNLSYSKININYEKDKIFNNDANFGQISYTENEVLPNFQTTESTDQNLQKDYCRLCSKYLPIAVLIPVDDNYQEIHDICLPGKNENDNVFHMICSFCAEELKISYSALNNCGSHNFNNGNEDAQISNEFDNNNSNLQQCEDQIEVKMKNSNDEENTGIKYQCLCCYKVFDNEKEITDHYFLNHPPGKQNQNIYRLVKVRQLRRNHKAISNKINTETKKEIEESDENNLNYKMVYEKPNKIKIVVDEKKKRTGTCLRYECLLCHSAHHTTKQAITKHSLLDHPENDGKVYCRILKPKKHRTQDIKCLVCPQLFKSIEKYRQHVKKHVFECDECGTTIYSNYELFKHKREHAKIKEKQSKDENDTTESEKYLCDVCGKLFHKYDNLYKHKLTHMRMYTFQCNVCERKFKSGTGLRLHKVKHNTFVCDCGKSFPTNSDLKQHSVIHEPKKHICNICGKAFRRLQTLVVHQEKHFPKLELERCEFCSEVFDCRLALKLHVYDHLDVKLFVCPVCTKSHADRRQLEIHMRCHSGDKPYDCEFCGKHFKSLKTVTVHKYIHFDISPYQCDICNKKFRQLSTLNDHRRIHTGEKPFKCSVCDKAFTIKANMVAHQKTHNTTENGEKVRPFLCKECGKSFTCKGNLTKHHRLIHPNKNIIGESTDDGLLLDFDLYDENIISDDYLNFLNANCEDNLLFQTLLIDDL